MNNVNKKYGTQITGNTLTNNGEAISGRLVYT